MGKCKKKRSQKRKNRHNPVALPLDANSSKSNLSPVALLRSLSSQTATDREAACIALAHVFATPNKQQCDYLLANNVLSLMMQRVLDPSREVRLQVCGALQNLANSDNGLICDKIVQQDMLTPVKQLILTTNTNPSDVIAIETVRAALNFLRNLCENSPAATAHLGDTLLFECIAKLFGNPSNPSPLALPALALFHSATDQNRPLIEMINQRQDVVDALRGYVQSTRATNENEMLLKLHACGIMVNAALEIENPSALGEVARPLLGMLVVDGVLESPIRLLTEDIVLGAESEAKQAAGEGYDATFASKEHAARKAKAVVASQGVEEEKPNNIESIMANNNALIEKFGEWNLRASVTLLALEVLTNLASGVDAPNDDEANQGGIMVLQELLRSSCVLEKIELSTRSVRYTLDNGNKLPKGITTVIQQWLRRATGCLDNLVQVLGAAVEGLPFANPVESWNGICHMCDVELPHSIETQDFDALEAITALMWSFLRANLLGAAPKELGQLGFSPVHLKAILHLAQAATGGSTGTRVNAVGMLGVLGQQISPADPESLEVGQGIKECCLAGVGAAPGSTESLQLASEAINAVIEVYGADEQDANFDKLGLLLVLENAHPRLSAMLEKADKASEEEDLAMLMDTREILSEFIAYKK